MTTILAQKIKAIRLKSGLDQTQFGERFKVSQSTVGRWERGAQPGHEKLQALADFAGTSIDQLLGVDEFSDRPADMLPVVGYVGAGAQVLPYDDYAKGHGMDQVERPAFVSGMAVAVEVTGDSLYPVAEEGWRLIYTGDQTILEEEVLNRLCVVQLTDGRLLVKRVMRGSVARRYHLFSPNAPLIEDVEIEWAARVKAIIPR